MDAESFVLGLILGMVIEGVLANLRHRGLKF